MNTNSISNNLALSSLHETSAVQKTTGEANTASANNLPVGSDQASLSHASTSLAQALNTSDVRMDKVAHLQQAIASGSYHVSSSDVADKILTSLTE